ncbi:hypothetical protein SiRe_0595 [Sulfolobus islandicus REY15A]|uniref:Uncharacterized protein n=1 Tax=Saccharolobus islandicus (strain REY15A) TaxID=930945 RepID=F0NDW9_SACI5|nr:hypothetical protein SiRe_0595 [Sulfolobus islandicus REY15A]
MYFQAKFYEFTNNRQEFEGIRKILPKGCKSVSRVSPLT